MKNFATQFRSHFPLIVQSAATEGLIYFDNGATTQKPQSVIDAITDYYTSGNANVHRATHGLAQQTTQKFEDAREGVRQFIGAREQGEIIWTKGATESLNMAAKMIFQSRASCKTNLVLTEMEHHANFVPWQVLAKQCGIEVRIIPVLPDGRLDSEHGLSLIDDQTLVVAVGHVSNASGVINPIESLIKKAKQHGAKTVIDGAQAVAHIDVNVAALDCDFYAFSGHKLYGPTGIGVLYGKRQLLDCLEPQQFGGEMVKRVSLAETEFAELPFKFEAGTPNIAGVLGLSAAIQFIRQFNSQDKIEHETLLTHTLKCELAQIKGVDIVAEDHQRISTIAFNVSGTDSNDLGLVLTQANVAIRVGHHCAMPYNTALDLNSTVRVSLSAYNTVEEIHTFIRILNEAIAMLSGESSVQALQTPSTDLSEKVTNAKGWDEKYRQVMLASKALKVLPENQRTTENEVFGCESQVWVSISQHNGMIDCLGYANGKIVRGLLALMFDQIQGKPYAEVNSVDFEQSFLTMGLGQQLSESRGNGIRAVADVINQKLINQ